MQLILNLTTKINWYEKITFKEVAPFLVLAAVAVIAIFIPAVPDYVDTKGAYNNADITWVLVASALVFLMTPGLAFFYGGMVHRKNVISTMIKSVAAAGVVSVLWIVVGFSLAFGDSQGGWIGNPSTHLFFKGVASGEPWGTIPKSLFAVFQLMFAIITPGLVVGAVAERIRFTSYILFIALFSLLVYCPSHTGPGTLKASCSKWVYSTSPVVPSFTSLLVVQPSLAYSY